jgi:glycosyltransferase involved in cell wall biosynthesis
MAPVLHVVGLPHTQLTKQATVCAFTQKQAKFGRMMSRRGWEVVFYWGEEHETECKELVPLFSKAEQEEWFGKFDANMLPIIAGAWDASQPQYQVTNARAIVELRKRVQPHDLVLLCGGLAQKPVYDALRELIVVEPAAGYSGIIASAVGPTGPWVCFESYAWKHYLYGTYKIADGRFFDTVIPNYFDPDEWSLSEHKGDHLCFVGRLIARKGPHIAAEIARELEMPLLVAGSGMAEVSEGLIVCQDGTRLEGDVHYMGTVGVEERNALMGEARALIVPTIYIEPFGAVAVEGPLCGTPAVATDFGAFTETVPRSLRFNTLAEGCEAVERAMDLDPERVREQALEQFSLEAVAPRYEEWFERLSTLWGRGWYEGTEARELAVR